MLCPVGCGSRPLLRPHTSGRQTKEQNRCRDIAHGWPPCPGVIAKNGEVYQSAPALFAKRSSNPLALIVVNRRQRSQRRGLAGILVVSTGNSGIIPFGCAAEPAQGRSSKESLNKYLLVAEGVHNTGFYADGRVRATLNLSLPKLITAARPP